MTKYITYKGEELPVKISFSAMKRFQNLTKKNLLQLQGELTMQDIEYLFFAAYVVGCKDEDIKQKYKQADMERILDEVYLEFIAMIPELMNVDKKKPQTEMEVSQE